MGRMKGTLTSVSMARPLAESLRTTIPVFIVKQMDLVTKDQLEWKIGMVDGEWIATIRKANGDD